MSTQQVKEALFTIASGELLALIQEAIPGQLSLRYDGPGVITPITGGVSDAHMGKEAPELRGYLNHGMAFMGDLTLQNTDKGLEIIGAKNLRTITTPNLPEQTMLRGILQAAEMIAGYRDAKIHSGLELSVFDWQGEERADKTTPDSVAVTISAEDNRISLAARNGRRIDLELQDGALRTLAYEAGDGRDAPVITSIPISGAIEIDREDYDHEARRDAQGPAI